MPSAPTLTFAPKGTTPLDLHTYIKQSNTTDEAILIDLNPHALPCLYAPRGCKKTFDLPEELEVHVRASITTDHDHEWCEKCNIGFYNVKELKRHWVTSPNDIHHHCPVCGYFELKSDGGLEIHVQRDHGNVRPGESRMLKCLACDVKVYGAIPMLQHFQVGVCQGLSPPEHNNNATIEELDTRGGVGEKAWPSLAVAAKSAPERKKMVASTVRVFNPIKKEKKEKLNIHKFTAEQRAVMSYSSPAVAREAMARPAGEGWGNESSAAKPVELDWSTEGNKVEVVILPKVSGDSSGPKRGVTARSPDPAIALPTLPKQKSLNPSQRIASQRITPATPALTTRLKSTTMPRSSAPSSQPSESTPEGVAQPSITNTTPSTKTLASSAPSPTGVTSSPHSQDIWDTPIPSKSSSSTPSSSIVNHNTNTWSNTPGKLASSPLAGRMHPKKHSRASTSKTQKPQDQWEGRDGWADAVQLRQKHLEQTRKNMQSELSETEDEGKSVSDWW